MVIRTDILQLQLSPALVLELALGSHLFLPTLFLRSPQGVLPLGRWERAYKKCKVPSDMPADVMLGRIC